MCQVPIINITFRIWANCSETTLKFKAINFSFKQDWRSKCGKEDFTETADGAHLLNMSNESRFLKMIQKWK